MAASTWVILPVRELHWGLGGWDSQRGEREGACLCSTMFCLHFLVSKVQACPCATRFAPAAVCEPWPAARLPPAHTGGLHTVALKKAHVVASALSGMRRLCAGRPARAGDLLNLKLEIKPYTSAHDLGQSPPGCAGYARGGQHAQGISPLLQRARPAGAPAGPPGLQHTEGPRGAAVGPPTLAPPGPRPVQGPLPGGAMPAGVAAGARQAQQQPLRPVHGSAMQGRAPGGSGQEPRQLGGMRQPALQPPPAGQHAHGLSPVPRQGPLQPQGGSAIPAGGHRGSPSGRGGRSASLMGNAGQGSVPGLGLPVGAAVGQWAPGISSHPPNTMGASASPGLAHNPNPALLQGQHTLGISPMLPKLQRAAAAAAGGAGRRDIGRYGPGSNLSAGAGACGAAAEEQMRGRGAAQEQGWPGHHQGAGHAHGSAAVPAHALGQSQPPAGAGALGVYAGVQGGQDAWASGSTHQARQRRAFAIF